MEKTAENQDSTNQPIKESEQKPDPVVDKKANESSDDEEVLTEEQAAMWGKIDSWLKEFYLTPFQMVACKKFLKDKVANPDDHTVDRCRQWVLMRLSGRKVPDKYHPR